MAASGDFQPMRGLRSRHIGGRIRWEQVQTPALDRGATWPCCLV
jgi:hypothetical protein